MKWAFVYQNHLNRPSANLKQTLLTTQALAQEVDLHWITAPFSKSSFKQVLNTFGVAAPKLHIAIEPELKDSNLIMEFKSRWIWNKNVLRWLTKNRIDIVYTRDFGFLVFLAIIKDKKEKQTFKVIYEPHKVYHRASKKVPKFIERIALNQVNYLTPITTGIWSDLHTDFGIGKPHIIVPDGLTPSPSFPYPASDSEFRMIYTGSFQKWKGLDTAIDALSSWRDRTGWSLTVCGGNPEEVRQLQNRLNALGLEKHVRLTGFLNDRALRAEVQLAHIALLPNTTETISARYTSPLKLFEYLGAGLPIVASDLPSIREVLSEEHAWFFEAENKDSLLEALEDARSNASRREALSQSNREYAKQFTWTHRAKRIVSIAADLR